MIGFARYVSDGHARQASAAAGAARGPVARHDSLGYICASSEPSTRSLAHCASTALIDCPFVLLFLLTAISMSAL
jgi:hypothetical protein